MSLILSIPFNNSTRNVGLQKNTITSVPSVTPSYISGPVKNALSFNGSTYWKSQGITLGADATICFWSKTSTNGRMPWVLESDASNILCLYESTYYTLNTGDGNSNLFRTDSNASIRVLRDNVWHHFAVTFGNGVAKLYIDGLYKGKAITFRNPTTSNKPIKIGGGYQNAHSYDWNGGIADFRVYDHCLMESDIQRIYNGDTKMLQVCLPFNKDERNVGLENVKPTSAGTFQIVSDATGLKCAKFGASTGYVKIPHDIFKKNTEMSMAFSINFNSWNTSYATPIGIFKSNNSWTGNTFTFLRNATTQVFFFNISNGSSSTQSGLKTGNLSLNTWYHFACVYKDRKMSLYQNGTLLGTYIPSFDPSFTAATLAIVGASTTGGSYQTDSKMSNVRFYNLALTDEDVQRIYQNEEIILLPTEYEKLEYIQSTGTQYIDTLIHPTINTGVQLKMALTTVKSADNVVFGATDKVAYANGKPYSIDVFSNQVLFPHGATSSNSLPYDAITASTVANQIMNLQINYYDDNKVMYNENKKSKTATASVTSRTLHLFNLNNSNGGLSQYAPSGMKCYSLKITEGSVLVGDFVPAKRKSDNVIGMYDMVSRQFFTNSGTGSFTGA